MQLIKDIVKSKSIKMIVFMSFLLFCLVQNSKSFGQKCFVTFETTNKSSIICQDKTLGVIATLEPEFEKHKSFEWNNDPDNFREVNNEIAIVNTATPGEKKLIFTLILESGERLDTSIIIKVFPKPDVQIFFKENKISISRKNEVELLNYSWIYNGVLMSESTLQYIPNPKTGNYKIIIKDVNGCTGSSETLQIK